MNGLLTRTIYFHQTRTSTWVSSIILQCLFNQNTQIRHLLLLGPRWLLEILSIQSFESKFEFHISSETRSSTVKGSFNVPASTPMIVFKRKDTRKSSFSLLYCVASFGLQWQAIWWIQEKWQTLDTTKHSFETWRNTNHGEHDVFHLRKRQASEKEADQLSLPGDHPRSWSQLMFFRLQHNWCSSQKTRNCYCSFTRGTVISL